FSPAIIVRIPTGTLIQKINGQEKCAKITPPNPGPAMDYSTNGQDNEKRFFDRNKKLDGKLVKKAVL
ncbi:hypothetical protein, partial [Enterococcus casseliflavus]|uniref:hypothetical protein n=1 Tax=Enterococcus casseliflavus TaxID=37734 RepID=UPI003A4C7F9D